MQGKLKCAIYTRVSTDNQAEVEFNSCEAQEEKIRSFINSQENMEVYKVYSDVGFTGANLNRPALNELIEDIKQRKIDIVIVYKIDRLTRSHKDFYYLIEIFERYNVNFISVTERFDTSTPAGRLLRNIMLTFAQFERELASERTKDKLLQRAQKGMWNGGIVPYGYKTEDKKLVVNEVEAKIVRKIFEDYITSGSIAKVYNELKTKDIKDRNGLPFSKSSISYILRNIIYTGKIKYAGKIYQGIHQPIISEDIFNLAQETHKKKQRVLRVYKNYLLAGLVKCKECGSYMTPSYTNKRKQEKLKRYYYYRCTKTTKRDWNSCKTKQVSADRLESYIFDNLERISIDKHYIDSLIFRLKNGAPGDRIGLEPSKICFESAKISGEIFAQTLQHLQTLQHFLKTLPQKKGIEKNLFIKKFIKEIIYSQENIQINLYFSRGFENLNFSFLDGANKKERRKIHSEFSAEDNNLMVRSIQNGSGFNSSMNYLPIILPNTIHGCKKKNL
jgi:site-specific DNA recombinase